MENTISAGYKVLIISSARPNDMVIPVPPTPFKIYTPGSGE
jgi:hypothetical protein